MEKGFGVKTKQGDDQMSDVFMDDFRAKLFHSDEFTDVEIKILAVWLKLVLGLIHPKLAIQVLAAGLRLEHYTSVLEHDPAQRSPLEVAEQQRRLTILNDLLRKADADDPGLILPTPDNPHPNAQSDFFRDLDGSDPQ
jgi:hypothetical protein